jgi:hypothetical protein
MVPTRLFNATVFVLLVSMTALATVGNVFHDASCSEACTVAAESTPNLAADSHAGCSHGHSHSSDSSDQNKENVPNEETPSHDSDQCGVCIFLSLASPPVVLTEAPERDESTEPTAVQSDSIVALAPRRTKTARGPPAHVV